MQLSISSSPAAVVFAKAPVLYFLGAEAAMAYRYGALQLQVLRPPYSGEPVTVSLRVLFGNTVTRRLPHGGTVTSAVGYIDVSDIIDSYAVAPYLDGNDVLMPGVRFRLAWQDDNGVVQTESSWHTALIGRNASGLTVGRLLLLTRPCTEPGLVTYYRSEAPQADVEGFAEGYNSAFALDQDTGAFQWLEFLGNNGSEAAEWGWLIRLIDDPDTDEQHVLRFRNCYGFVEQFLCTGALALAPEAEEAVTYRQTDWTDDDRLVSSTRLQGQPVRQRYTLHTGHLSRQRFASLTDLLQSDDIRLQDPDDAAVWHRVSLTADSLQRPLISTQPTGASLNITLLDDNLPPGLLPLSTVPDQTALLEDNDGNSITSRRGRSISV